MAKQPWQVHAGLSDLCRAGRHAPMFPSVTKISLIKSRLGIQLLGANVGICGLIYMSVSGCWRNRRKFLQGGKQPS